MAYIFLSIPSIPSAPPIQSLILRDNPLAVITELLHSSLCNPLQQGCTNTGRYGRLNFLCHQYSFRPVADFWRLEF
jgi:hypothetical protein